MTLYTLKYAPKSTAELIGQEMAIPQLKDFVINYKRQKQKAALLWGPIGCGKTSSVYALATELKYEILEINSSDLRNQDNIKSFLDSALGQQSLFFVPKMILIDEIDNISGVKDRGCIPALLKAIEKSSFPIILTANDPFEQKLKSIKKASLGIEYRALSHPTIAAQLKNICTKETITFEEKALNSLSRQADGDLRAALIDLQICSADKNCTFERVTSLSERKRTDSILQALAVIFKSSSVQTALPALDDVDVDIGEIFFWIDNNLPKEYKTAQSLARAYESLTRADVFNGRIKRQQHWRFLVYITNLLTAGISSAKLERNTEFIPYKPTMRILKMWQAKMKHAHREGVAEKLAAATHTSKKVARQQLSYLQMQCRHGGGQEIIKELELSDEEMEWLRK